MEKPLITASMLYDLVNCPHRVWLDLYGDESRRDPVSSFVQMLWERGSLHEQDIIDGADVEYTDLSKLSGKAKEEATMEAIRRGDPMIYSGRLQADDLLGVPDLLRKEADGYVAGDIKSGAALEGGSDLEDGKPKDHYAVQLALYTDILERLNISSGELIEWKDKKIVNLSFYGEQGRLVGSIMPVHWFYAHQYQQREKILATACK